MTEEISLEELLERCKSLGITVNHNDHQFFAYRPTSDTKLIEMAQRSIDRFWMRLTNNQPFRRDPSV